MRIVVYHTKFYDWERVPNDVKVEQKDIDAGRVRPSTRDGEWVMRVIREPKGGTHTTIHISERSICGKIIEKKCHLSDGRTLSRQQAVYMILVEQVLQHHTMPSWITGFDVHDDGPDESLLTSMLEPHGEAINPRTGAPNIDSKDHAAHVKLYGAKEPASLQQYLNASFRVKSEQTK